jgi:membrane protein implicated in regulation of membrane protease activity
MSVVSRDAYERLSRRAELATRLLGFWMVLVALFFLFQALDYRGLAGWLAERQFLYFDHYWPTLTFLGLTALFSIPFIIAVWLLRRRQRRMEQSTTGRIDDRRIVHGKLARTEAFFVGACAGGLLAAIIVLIMRLQLPSDEGLPRSIVLGTPDAIAPVEGRAVLRGQVDLSETAQFNEDLLLVKRTFYFAPIRARGETGALRYFVEVRRNAATQGYDDIRFPEAKHPVQVWRFRVPRETFTAHTDGLLRRHALPGEIVNLYRLAGHEVDSDNYVLFSSIERLSWRYYVLAGEFCLWAVLAGIAALLLARRKRAVERRMKEERHEASPAGEPVSPAQS